METPHEIQVVLDKMHAEEIAAYIIRRNKKHPGRMTNLRHVCVRFRISQQEAKRIFSTCRFLFLSNFAYKPFNGRSFAEGLFAALVPQIWQEAPEGDKLVQVFDDELPANKALNADF